MKAIIFPQNIILLTGKKTKNTWTFATLLHKWINIINIKLTFHIETKKNVAAHIGPRTLDPEIKSLILYGPTELRGVHTIVGKFTIFISHKTRMFIQK